MFVELALAAASCPVLKQLLGWHAVNSGLWGGKKEGFIEDVPL